MSLFENFEYGTFAGDVIDAADGVSDVGDVIFGLGGADWLFGLGGCDWLDGGAGGDYLNGGSDFDTASYEYSNAGVTIDLTNGYGYGGTAAGDTLESIENVTGSPYGDTLLGNDVHNVLWGMSGNDVLKGGGGDDELRGVNGDDTLEGGAGADFLQGAWGVDTAAYTTSDEGVMVALWSGAAHYGDAEGDTFGAIENLTGSNHADSLIGDDGVNVLSGMSGNDSLKGLGGADTLEGGFGDDHLDGDTGGDTMIGGFGDDTYYVDNWWDVVTEAGGQGADTVLTSVSWELTAGADVEYLRTTNPNGTAAINLTGNASGNAIVGNDGNNLIIGGGGVDEMTGRDGNDSYFVDNAGDMVIESGGQGIDAVRASVSYTLAAGVDVETLSTTQLAGTDAINLTGNSSGSRRRQQRNELAQRRCRQRRADRQRRHGLLRVQHGARCREQRR